jgi:hypothetical protein
MSKSSRSNTNTIVEKIIKVKGHSIALKAIAKKDDAPAIQTVHTDGAPIDVINAAIDKFRVRFGSELSQAHKDGIEAARQRRAKRAYKRENEKRESLHFQMMHS